MLQYNSEYKCNKGKYRKYYCSNIFFLFSYMYIQLYVRDYSVRISSERNITQPMYLLHINKISDHWLKAYFSAKKEHLAAALKDKIAPAFCSHRESWHGRKCVNYCDVHEECKRLYAASLPVAEDAA